MGLLQALLFFLAGINLADASIPPTGGVIGLKPSPEIRVRVAQKNGAEVRGFDLMFESRQTIRPISASATERLSRWSVSCSGARVRVRSAAGVEGEFRSPVLLASPAGFFQIDTHPYRERVEIRSVPGKGCQWINRLELEKYLEGVVNSEFSARWSREAVAAQVIAARSYAFSQIRTARRNGRAYDVESSVKDQVYEGARSEDYLAARAVSETRGVVLGEWAKDEKEPRPILAYYHSTCGGGTELPQRVWPRVKSSGAPVLCGFCRRSPRYQWTLELEDREILSTLARIKSPAPLGAKLDRFQIAALGAFGRAEQLELGLRVPGVAQPVDLRVPAAAFREALGATRMRSTWISIERKAPGGWLLRGKGNGHGAGLCQYGAKAMGEAGLTRVAILQHYYPGAVVMKMW